MRCIVISQYKVSLTDYCSIINIVGRKEGYLSIKQEYCDSD